MPFVMNYKQLHMVKKYDPVINIDRGINVDPKSVFL